MRYEIAGIRHKGLTVVVTISSSERLLPISSKSRRQTAGAVSFTKLVWATAFPSKTIHVSKQSVTINVTTSDDFHRSSGVFPTTSPPRRLPLAPA
jgi:hypothetical protein